MKITDSVSPSGTRIAFGVLKINETGTTTSKERESGYSGYKISRVGIHRVDMPDLRMDVIIAKVKRFTACFCSQEECWLAHFQREKPDAIGCSANPSVVG
jgi:hypothetical protein